MAIIASLCSGLTLILVATKSWQDLISFAVLGIVAVLASITYTIGRKPYGYIGLGDISVLIFFGWLGVGGTYYLQTNSIDFPVLLVATAPCGLLATAVLNINNLRDIEQDRKAGKNTLAVRLGDKPAKIYHCLLIATAIVLYLTFTALLFALVRFLGGFSVPVVDQTRMDGISCSEPQQLRPMLAQMSILALLVNLLFSIGLLLSHGFNW